MKSLKGHKDLVYCVTWAKNGKMFASGGADKTVILWGDDLEGIVKFAFVHFRPMFCRLIDFEGKKFELSTISLMDPFRHNETIQCLAFNPVNFSLLSCSTADFGWFFFFP